MASSKAALLLLICIACWMQSLHANRQPSTEGDLAIEEFEAAFDSSRGKISGFRGEDVSAWASIARNTSGQASQSQMLRMLRSRKRYQRDAEPARRDAVSGYDAPLEESTRGPKRAVLEEQSPVKGKPKIPAQQLADLVEKLPGQPEVDFAQYAGYITTNESAGRALFYYFVEATSDPESKPLSLWLNGGPGCSSLGYGAWEELGPFRVKNDGATLYRNHYAWNKVASFLFVESPVGVGFSYSNTTSDYVKLGDTITAAENFIFLQKWFERFPQYKYRDLYFTGESYAGNYVPQLAKLVYEHNKGLSKPIINLKGFLVGNAVTDYDEDNRGLIEYWWTHAQISDETYAVLQKCEADRAFETPLCSKIVDDAYAEQGNIDPYSIYTPACLHPISTLERHPKGTKRFKGYDPCIDNYVSAYLNRPDVQEALHANVTRVSFPWAPCSDLVNLNWQDSELTVIPIYRELIDAGLKVWVMSGDVDSVVPVTSTRYSLRLLKLKTKVAWHPWYRSDQVGGYTQEYDGLTLVTVRGAGHEIPLFQPARALTLITSYITGVPLPIK